MDPLLQECKSFHPYFYMDLGDETIPKSRRDAPLMRCQISGHGIRPPSQEGDPAQRSLDSHSAQFPEEILVFQNPSLVLKKATHTRPH